MQTTKVVRSIRDLKVGQTIMAGIRKRKATITAISDRDPGKSPIKGGKILHLSGAHDMTMLEGDRITVVEAQA